MIQRGEHLDEEPHRAGKKEILTKEDAVARILELVCHAIDGQ